MKDRATRDEVRCPLGREAECSRGPAAYGAEALRLMLAQPANALRAFKYKVAPRFAGFAVDGGKDEQQ